MIIKILNHIENETNHRIEIRIEQEFGAKNSFNWLLEFNKLEFEHLSQDELYTLAWIKVKDKTINKFKQVEYVEEEITPIDFELINSNFTNISELNLSRINKKKRNKYSFNLNCCIFDQYNINKENIILTLQTIDDNISFIDGILSIDTDNIQSIDILAEYNEYSKVFNIPIVLIDPEPTLEEKQFINDSMNEGLMEEDITDIKLKNTELENKNTELENKVTTLEQEVIDLKNAVAILQGGA